jgi:hypothetical protein
MDPARALATLERALRQLMEHAYRAQFGDAWLDQVTTPEQRERWQDRARDEEARRGRRGVSRLPEPGLAYADLYALRTVLEANWDPLAPALKEKKEIVALLKRFDSIRNAVAHSRDVLPFEQDLLAGIAGDIANRVTVHMSSQDPSGDYYPRITRVSDSFGSEPAAAELARAEHWAHCSTGLTLRPGDVVRFSCQGVDPQGRELDWALSTNMGVAWTAFTSGSEAIIEWVVSPHDVQDEKTVLVYMRAGETTYHRRGTFDHGASFKYRVLPPAG